MLELAGAFRNLTGVFKDRETCVKEWGAVCAERAPKALNMFDTQKSFFKIVHISAETKEEGGGSNLKVYIILHVWSILCTYFFR